MLQRDTCSPSPATVPSGPTQPRPSTSAHVPNVKPVPQTEDRQLVAATLLALETGDLTPLIKEELKYTIQARRVSQGKRELRVHFREPHPYKLTPEEEKRVEKRREQNREAAQRFRRKQKDQSQVFRKRIQTLEISNTKLRAELRLLQEDKTQLAVRLASHMCVCSGLSTPGPGLAAPTVCLPGFSIPVMGSSPAQDPAAGHVT